MTEKPAKKAAKAETAVFELPKFEMPKFEMPKLDAFQSAEVPAALREVAEKSLEQAKALYEKVKVSAEEATDLVEDTYETARAGSIEFNLKALEAVKANTDAAYGFAKDLISVKTFAEAVELQTAFARKSFDAVTAQAKELQELATKVANDTAKPVKAAIEKTMKDFKAA